MKYFLILSGKMLFFSLILGANVAKLSAKCVFSKNLQTTETQVGNVMTWATSNEEGHDYFGVEKSLDGSHFNEIGKVKGTTGGKGQDYRFLDPSVGESKIYYRLAVKGLDGQIVYTQAVMLDRHATIHFTVTAMSPTLTDHLFALTIKTAAEGLMQYNISSNETNATKSGVYRLMSGENAHSFDLSGLPVGNYELSLKMGEQNQSIRLKKVGSGQAPQMMLTAKEK